ncbi:hypothetical protein AL035_02305 [Salipiger aestuarii]|uniref:Uncharacterized protein n=1 Tax=Salipiger aestuarii TaxID=568098 RepID=A0A327YTS2_9RHOB|nr:hypothetical protein [Salipiger aestuarii]KAB2543314.1 hypothetical protein AL035_02305 [Salipiger aestuarii]RAK24022.1 hypothetical protein ATI53_1001129 [Salipiger aestuarii]
MHVHRTRLSGKAVHSRGIGDAAGIHRVSLVLGTGAGQSIGPEHRARPPRQTTAPRGELARLYRARRR